MSKLLTFILLILYTGPVQLWASSHADQARYNSINRSETARARMYYILWHSSAETTIRHPYLEF